MASPRAFLDTLFSTAVAAAHPKTCLPPLLPEPPRGRLILLAAGKAAGSMAETAEAHYLDRLRIAAERLSGVAVARHGYGRHLKRVRMIEAGHPVPDAAGLEAAELAIKLADSATADDLVLVLMSGGASANWIAPAHGVSFADKQAVTRALLRSGANIGEINTVRKHLSRIKGGRLARHAYPAKLVTIAISDVPGDDPSAIGSGPTVPDPTTLADARAIVAKYQLALPGGDRRCAQRRARTNRPSPATRLLPAAPSRWRRGRRIRCARRRRSSPLPATNASCSAIRSRARHVTWPRATPSSRATCAHKANAP